MERNNNVDPETGFHLKFLDGTPAEADYLDRVSGLIDSAVTAEKLVFIDDLEQYADAHRDNPPRTTVTARPTHHSRLEVADIMLAAKTGWSSIYHNDDRLWGHHDDREGVAPVPRPCLEWASCGPLLAQYDLSVDSSIVGKVAVFWRDQNGARHEVVAEYEDALVKEVTLRYAIVLASYERVKNVPYTDVIQMPNVEQYIRAINGRA